MPSLHGYGSPGTSKKGIIVKFRFLCTIQTKRKKKIRKNNILSVYKKKPDVKREFVVY